MYSPDPNLDCVKKCMNPYMVCRLNTPAKTCLAKFNACTKLCKQNNSQWLRQF